ncbi:MAG: TonB-dependent receptor, partial [Novosphingobium sp.]|nr:TonB-dependent receptor [Novosphingobium sp.]
MFFRQLPLFILAIASPAVAQRTTSNVVTASDDAFGRAVGNDKIGIYSIESVRGFNPIEAGNVRIEGLYFDQQSTPSSRLVDSSAVRVGYAAKGYPFPAPTGIADLQIEKFEGKRVISLDV